MRPKVWGPQWGSNSQFNWFSETRLLIYYTTSKCLPLRLYVRITLQFSAGKVESTSRVLISSCCVHFRLGMNLFIFSPKLWIKYSNRLDSLALYDNQSTRSNFQPWSKQSTNFPKLRWPFTDAKKGGGNLLRNKNRKFTLTLCAVERYLNTS